MAYGLMHEYVVFSLPVPPNILLFESQRMTVEVAGERDAVLGRIGVGRAMKYRCTNFVSSFVFTTTTVAPAV